MKLGRRDKADITKEREESWYSGRSGCCPRTSEVGNIRHHSDSGLGVETRDFIT